MFQMAGNLRAAVAIKLKYIATPNIYVQGAKQLSADAARMM